MTMLHDTDVANLQTIRPIYRMDSQKYTPRHLPHDYRQDIVHHFKRDCRRSARSRLRHLQPTPSEICACIVLHALGFSGPQIKFLLRWASDCFMEYLHNLGVLSTLQNEAIADIENMPNFL